MGTSDGSVVGITQIVNHGSASRRWNLVILSEGYQSTEMTKFHNDAQSFVQTMNTTKPFDELWSAINIYRIDVTSTDSGAADPTACGGSGIIPHTYFDASFCNSGIRRLLICNDATVHAVVNAQMPQAHMIMVIVNSTVYGGSGGGIATFSLAAGANEIALHEMGHTAFGFADEYEYFAGCLSGESGHDHYSGGEPSQPNVTKDANRATNKWRDLIAASTPMPTTTNADCSKCDPQANPFGAATVGAYEGAFYNHCGAYRPQFDCRMRALNNPYCAVCQQVIRKTLAPFMIEPVYAQGDPGNGIGGYDLRSPADQAFAFDYDSSGKLDHLALYRPGTGTIWILKNSGGAFSPVYNEGDPGNGIGGYDLKSLADRVFALDYDSSGKLDHLTLYRPGTGTIWILKKT